MGKIQDQGSDPAAALFAALTRNSRKTSFRWKLLLCLVGILLVVVTALIVFWRVRWPNSQVTPETASVASQLTREQRAITNSIGMKFVLIPAGEFLMGSLDSDKDANPDEKPQHRVRITQPFYMGACEVTQGEYLQVMGDNPSCYSITGRFSDTVAGQDTSRLPVESVSWDDAVEFCRRLSAMPEERTAGRTYRLPTEAEWEYACRAGTTSRWSFGDDPPKPGDYAWFVGNSKITPDKLGTHPVGQKKPNAWGLYDMHGNVSEWCADWYAADFYGKSPVDNPSGPGFGEDFMHVLRGGSWRQEVVFRCAARETWQVRNLKLPLHGFRVVRTFRP